MDLANLKCGISDELKKIAFVLRRAAKRLEHVPWSAYSIFKKQLQSATDDGRRQFYKRMTLNSLFLFATWADAFPRLNSTDERKNKIYFKDEIKNRCMNSNFETMCDLVFSPQKTRAKTAAEFAPAMCCECARILRSL